MTEVEAIRILESRIKGFAEHVETFVIENYEKLNQPILIVFFKRAANKIKIFDAVNGIDAIAEITYTQHKHKVFISSYEVISEYQQNGLGKLLFNLALAHSDYNGITSVYGHATPINEVKGISSTDKDSYDKIQQVLYKIYEKLGCEFDFYGENNTFSQEWKSGDKFKKIPKEFQKLITEFERLEVKNHTV